VIVVSGGTRLPFGGSGEAPKAPPLPTGAGVTPLPKEHWRFFTEMASTTAEPGAVWPGWEFNYVVEYESYLGHWLRATGGGKLAPRNSGSWTEPENGTLSLPQGIDGLAGPRALMP